MSLFFNIMAAGGSGPKLTLTGATVNGGTSGQQGIVVNTDGTIDQLQNGSTGQLSAPTDWIIPNSAANSSYEVRVTNVVWTLGSAFSTAAEVDDTWIAISVARGWYVQDLSSSAAGVQNVTFDLEIRLGSSGAALASASYTLIADYEI